jgi:hypothetical protein
MKKNLFLIVFVGFLLVACIASSGLSFSKKDVKDFPNLIKNSDFEQRKDSNAILKNWTVMDDSAKKFVRLTNQEHFKGNNAIEIVNPTKDVLIISAAFEIKKDGGYYSYCHLKSLKKTDKRFTLLFFAFDKNGKRKDRYREKYRITQNWKQYDISSGFFDKNVKYGRVIISLPKDENQIYYLDDIESFKVYKFHK